MTDWITNWITFFRLHIKKLSIELVFLNWITNRITTFFKFHVKLKNYNFIIHLLFFFFFTNKVEVSSIFDSSIKKLPIELQYEFDQHEHVECMEWARFSDLGDDPILCIGILKSKLCK